MIMHLILPALLAGTPGARDATHVPLPVLATNVWAYVDRPLVVCGTFQGVNSPAYPKERVLGISSRGNGYWFLVDFSSLEPPRDGVPVCVKGVVRHRDELTLKKAREMNIGVSYVADGLQNPDFVLHPEEISLAASRPRKAGRVGGARS